MKTIEAFKCEFSGAVFEDQRRARKSEFNALMKRVGGSLPAMGSIGSDKIMEWLAGTVESEVYPTVSDKLREALSTIRLAYPGHSITKDR
jgi:hypothetical protein